MLHEAIRVEHADIVLEIMNSNREYNRMENGSELRSRADVLEEMDAPGQKGWMLRDKQKYVGVLLFMDENPKDGFPWLGLLMIQGNEKGKGYGKAAYRQFEGYLKLQGRSIVRIGVIQENEIAKSFWTALGFEIIPHKKRAGHWACSEFIKAS